MTNTAKLHNIFVPQFEGFFSSKNLSFRLSILSENRIITCSQLEKKKNAEKTLPF